MSLILAFDTSAPHCAAALLDGDSLIASQREEMARGQAERLVPLLEELLATAGRNWSELSALAVGVGPGNFTGIRISVSLARGLALGLGIPAIGVTGFDMLAHGQPRPLLATLPAPRNQLYGQLFLDEGPGEARLFAAEEIPAELTPEDTLIIGAAPGARPAPENPAPLIAAVATTRIDAAHGAPAPFYLRPADAAPPRDAPPRIIP
ncbi:tRNA threonylcarbamoyl adenosine modification protein YeaZ [Pseudooceanicola antarcticus]|uniref:tRNA (Adenosine(37)-N6)-threonylcarbamoyltransferase complex dimerization subunit type 1 TsaB n=1 Tax=Pseudooceanicola antarcticus TaxID=1247613 RepID=A0A285IGL7_9RHOB|nr:tRNA (adenosine(37)-N6)-threonylcarbamoyltransferase complex dimerization subunit type 1 TsaB [Pseudooceanicola antarcticus]PJE29030.1 tRNA (adenosine(37)-N6)-threonylcarbamoyltransferase complex dimerization subunit type 1 TsaB [Pseudooceanicola antarcticus]SNY47125.1 tRNA threonylcarbamoyl adenosine modification protein YeaZ [Pseudooceanicola antarcticus]